MIICSFFLCTIVLGCNRNIPEAHKIDVKNIKSPCEAVRILNDIYKEMIVLRKGKETSYIVNNPEEFKQYMEYYNKTLEIREKMSSKKYQRFELEKCDRYSDMMENYHKAEDD